MALGGKWSRELFDRQARLKHINKLKHWPVTKVLQDKYDLNPLEGRFITLFIAISTLIQRHFNAD